MFSVRSYRWCGGIGSGKSAALRLAVSAAMARGLRPIGYLPSSTDVGLRTERVAFSDHDLAVMLGADQLTGRLVRHLSSGERQRVRLACCLSRNTRFAALDEPCRHLDPEHVESLNRLLETRVKDQMQLAVCDSRRQLAASLFEEECKIAEIEQDTPELLTRTGKDALSFDLPIPFLLSCTGRATGKQRVDIEGGSLVVVRGANGSGKTSLLEALARTATSTGSKIGICRQEPEHQVFASTPSSEFAAVSATHQGSSWYKKNGTPERSFDSLIANLQLGRWLNHSTPRIPLGVLSLLGTAIALWLGQDLVLLDEPTQGMDAKTTKILVSELLRRAKAGARIVVASHDPLLVRAASQEWLLDAGSLWTGATA